MIHDRWIRAWVNAGNVQIHLGGALHEGRYDVSSLQGCNPLGRARRNITNRGVFLHC
jgi:hypothetical protein